MKRKDYLSPVTECFTTQSEPMMAQSVIEGKGEDFGSFDDDSPTSAQNPSSMWDTLILLFVLVLSSCAGDELSDDPRPTPVEVCTTAFTPEEEAVVRSTVDPTASPVAFSWQAGDQLAVYAGGDASGLTNFDCVQVDGEDPSLAQFRPNGFNLNAGASYYAFYPYNAASTDKTSIDISYAGIRQTADGTYDHLGACDYQYSVPTEALDGGESTHTRFYLKHAGCVVRLRISGLPAGHSFSNLHISSPKLISSGTLDISTDEPCIKAAGSNLPALDIALGTDGEGMKSSADGTLTIYTMMAPTDLKDQDIFLDLRSMGGSDLSAYSTSCAGKTQMAGRAHGYSAKMNPIDPQEHHYVDLDLYRDDGTKILFATELLGTDTEHPHGLLYAWGEREAKSVFNPENYLYTQTDPVAAAWGPDWRMATKAELQKLAESEQKTGYTWTLEGDAFSVVHNTATLRIPFTPGTASWPEVYLWSSNLQELDRSGRHAQYFSIKQKSKYDDMEFSISNIETYNGYGILPVYVGNLAN